MLANYIKIVVALILQTINYKLLFITFNTVFIICFKCLGVSILVLPFHSLLLFVLHLSYCEKNGYHTN